MQLQAAIDDAVQYVRRPVFGDGRPFRCQFAAQVQLSTTVNENLRDVELAMQFRQGEARMLEATNRLPESPPLFHISQGFL